MEQNLNIKVSIASDVGLEKSYYRTEEARIILGLYHKREVREMIHMYDIPVKRAPIGWFKIPKKSMERLIICHQLREQTGMDMYYIYKYKLWEQLKL